MSAKHGRITARSAAMKPWNAGAPSFRSRYFTKGAYNLTWANRWPIHSVASAPVNLSST